MYGSPAYYQAVQGKYTNEVELSIIAGAGAPLLRVTAEHIGGHEFLVHDQDEDGVVEISVSRLSKDIVQRAVSSAIGRPSSVTWAVAQQNQKVA